MAALTKDIAFSETKFDLQWKHIFDAGWDAAKRAEALKTSHNSTMLEIAWCLREVACVLNDVIDVPLDIKNRVDAVLAQLQQ